MNSRHVNWTEEGEYNGGAWVFSTRSLLSEKEREDDPDAGIPMMNYAYPLEFTKDVDEAKILEVYNRTNCCVVYNQNEEEYYLALTGGGMDLSQDIAFAYIILEKWIPEHLLDEVCLQPMLSVGREDFETILKHVKKGIERRKGSNKYLKEKIKRAEEKLKEG